jgi:hypothetical protein
VRARLPRQLWLPPVAPPAPVALVRPVPRPVIPAPAEAPAVEQLPAAV